MTMLCRLYAPLAALILLTSIATAQVVNIPDPNLRVAIHATLELPSGANITQQDMLQLERFESKDNRIKDLTGIEYAANLTFLVLSVNEIHDITPIAGLTKLDFLIIRDNPVEDLDVLRHLTALRYLNISGILVRDLSFISSLRNLQELVAINCRLSDISALAGMTQLRMLNMPTNQITDISPLSDLVNLESLRLGRNQIVDISPLANLTALKVLQLHLNPIADVSPVSGLELDVFTHDEECDSPGLPVQDRIENRSLPSIFLPWENGIRNVGGEWWDESILYEERITSHDLWWHFPGRFGIQFKLGPQGYRLVGNMPEAIEFRDDLLSKNPNMIILADLRQRYAPVSVFGEDWFGWLRDDDGNLLVHGGDDFGQILIDFIRPEVQDVIVQRAVAVAQCGLVDGIIFDAWGIDRFAPVEDRYSILNRIREQVPENFLILFNTNHFYIPELAPLINGSFMETFPDVRDEGYTRDRIIEIETNLIRYELNTREPHINCLRGFGVGSEPPDSSNNLRWMRLFATMSLTCSDGYSIYTLGDLGGQRQFQRHIWHPFWGADLGQPIGETTQRYDNIEGLYIRDFTNGWAVYNRSGSANVVELPEQVQSVQSGIENVSHVVLDLDGDIFLRVATVAPADINGDGVVNILDLVIVAQSLGTGENDVNGDGVTNVFDLVIIANAINR